MKATGALLLGLGAVTVFVLATSSAKASAPKPAEPPAPPEPPKPPGPPPPPGERPCVKGWPETAPPFWPDGLHYPPPECADVTLLDYLQQLAGGA